MDIKKSKKPIKLFIDLKNIRNIDAEGLNHILLILLHLVYSYEGIIVGCDLPLAANVVWYIGKSGILKYLNMDHFVGRPPSLWISSNTEELVKTYPLTNSSKELLWLFREKLKNILTDNDMQLLNTDRIVNSTCQIVFQLLHNVFEHSEANHGCVTLEYLPRKVDKKNGHSRYLCIAVSDLGIGIKASFRERAKFDFGNMFDRFTESDYLEYAIQPGTSRFGPDIRGNGLSIVTKIASVMYLTSGQATISINNRDSRRNINRKKIENNHGTSLLVILDLPVKHGRKAKEYTIYKKK